MGIDFQRFFEVCTPDYSLDLANPKDSQYYIDFSTVRSDKVIQRLGRTITRSTKTTCQLFSGHIGCGKSTELFHLKAELQKEAFYVVYFDCKDDLDLNSVDVTDVLLAIAQRVSDRLEDDQIYLEPQGFRKFLQEAVEFLNTPIDLTAAKVKVPGGPEFSANREGKFEFSLPAGIASITAEARKDKNLHDRLRQYVAPRTKTLLKVINEELLEPATAILKQRGKRGLVVIVDSLDRVNSQLNAAKQPQDEALFIHQGEDLRKLSCHLVYTIPLVLLFTNDRAILIDRLGGGTQPTRLPMVPVQSRNGAIHEEGLRLLRQMVLRRAFPELTDEERLDRLYEVFDSPATLDRLCLMSGGHVRKLMSLLYGCLQTEDLPLSRGCLDEIIRNDRDSLLDSVDDDEWKLIVQVVRQKTIQGDAQFKILLPSMFFFEYQDEEGRWFGVNPVLAETKQFNYWQENLPETSS